MAPSNAKTNPTSFPDSSNSGRYLLLSYLLPIAILVLSLILTMFLWKMYDNSLKVRSQSIFAGRTNEITSRIVERFDDHENVLRGAAGLFSVNEDVTRVDWRHYVSALQLDKSYPGILGIGFAKWLTPAMKDANIRKIRSEGFPEYTIRPDGERPVYTSIIYLEPFNWRNQRAFGYDMYTEPVRRAALDKARDENVPTIAAKIILVQEIEKDKQSGMLMFVPVYTPGVPLDTVELRHKAFIGFAYSPIRMNDFIYGTLETLPKDIAFDISIVAKQTSDNLMFSSVQAEKQVLPENYTPAFTSTKTVQAYGCTWQVTFKTLPGFNKELNQQLSYILLSSCILFSILVPFMVFLMLKNRNMAIERGEEKILNLNNRLSLAAESAQIGVWDYIVPENRLIWDKWMYALYGIQEESFGGAYEAWQNGLHPDDKVRGDEEISQALRGEKDFNTEFRVVWPTGEVRYIKATALVLPDADGKPFRMIGVNYDITERKRTENELRIARDMAEAAEKAKSTFLASMSHEIRTPLNAIIGITDLMAETPLDRVQSEYMSVAKSAGEALQRIIDDILDLSKIEAGMLQLDTVPFRLSDCAQKVTGMLSAHASQKKIVLESSLTTGVPVWLLGDSYRLCQILINLVGNAIKFTEQGGVNIRIDPVSSCGNEVVLKFSITDTGIGISPDNLQIIFENFTQTDTSTTRIYGGSGLGLAISKKLVEMMGGELHVESTIGVGSCFSFTCRFVIPLDTPEEPLPKIVAENKPSRNLSILLVDDNKDNRTVLSAYFRKTEHTVEIAVNGEEAVSKIKQGSYDLVLLDMEMPVMDGYTAVRLIRDWEQETGRTSLPIIALTANALKEDHQRSLAAGCTEHLTKPIHKDKLLEVVTEYAAIPQG